MNGLSLFAGIGGLDLGLERAGVTVVGQVEIDPFCRRVLAKHWPDVPRHDDVRTAADWWLNGEDRPHVDVVFGGFPCQDISNAGRRAGIDGERSGLWSAFADVIRHLRPRYAVLENVAAVLARGAGAVLGDLAEIGYDAEWDCVPAAAVGAPHLRDRWFAVAYPQRQQLRHEPVTFGRRVGAPIAGDDGTASAVADPEGQRRELRPAEGSGPRRPAGGGSALADTDSPGLERRRVRGAAAERGPLGDAEGLRLDLRPGLREGRPRGGAPARVFVTKPADAGWWAAEPDVGRVAYGVPGRVDRLRGLGNAVVPQVAEHVGRLLMAMEDAA